MIRKIIAKIVKRNSNYNYNTSSDIIEADTPSLNKKQKTTIKSSAIISLLAYQHST